MGPLDGLARFISAISEGDGEEVDEEGFRLRRGTSGMREGASCIARRFLRSAGVVPGVDFASWTSLALCA